MAIKEKQSTLSHFNGFNLNSFITSFKQRKKIIFIFAMIFVLLGFNYVNNIDDMYTSKSSFYLPNSLVVNNLSLQEVGLNVNGKNNTEYVFSGFLKLLLNQNFQKEIFDNNIHLTAIDPSINNSIENREDFKINEYDLKLVKFLNSIKLTPPSYFIEKDVKTLDLLELPYELSIEGYNSQATSKFLSDLIIAANKRFNQQLVESIVSQANYLVDNINVEINQSIELTKNQRESEIERLIEQNNIKILKVENEIAYIRNLSGMKRLIELNNLESEAKIAKALGITKNNFTSRINEASQEKLVNIINSDEARDLPDWYFFGENALRENIARINESTFMEIQYANQVADLESSLIIMKNNPTLKTYQARKDDKPFTLRVSDLILERNKLITLKEKSINLEFSSIQVEKPAFSKIHDSRKGFIFALFVMAGFFLGLIAVLVYESLFIIREPI